MNIDSILSIAYCIEAVLKTHPSLIEAAEVRQKLEQVPPPPLLAQPLEYLDPKLHVTHTVLKHQLGH